MPGLKDFFQIIRRHPLTSAFDLSLAAITMALGIGLAFAYDIAALWSDLAPRERDICREEVFALGLLFALCAAIFTWRRLLEERQDHARWQRAENELREQRSLAMSDPLTSLPNRRKFLLALDIAISQKSGATVFLLDLNGFKAINDTFGHATGDEVLKIVASRFREAARSEDMVARLGGDEFAVLAGSVESNQQARDIGHRFVDALTQAVAVDGQIHTVGVALGIAIWPEDGTTSAAIMKSADTAMYQAKRSVASAVSFFEDNDLTLERSV